MTSAIKSILILLIALPLAIYLGNELGSDDFVLPLIAVALLIGSLTISVFFREQRLECLILTFLLAGNIVGNRGFAQLAIVQPFFVAEVGMAAIGLIMLVRYLISRESLGLDRPISRIILVFLLYGIGRFCFDVGTYHLDAVRDLAQIYYAFFFFVAFNLGQQEESARFLDSAMVWIVGMQSIIAVLMTWWPEALDSLEVRGVSVLTQKGDLTPTFAAMGLLYLSLRPDVARPAWLRRLIILVLLVCLAFTPARAAIVALGFGLLLPLFAVPRRLFVYPAIFVLTATTALFVAGEISDNSRVKVTEEELMSIVDFSNSFHYETDVGDMKGTDNDFRRELWRSIFKQTIDDNEWIQGKGFGYDFIPRFEKEYNKGSWDTLRSAHNYFVTIFGRAGAVGLALLLAITFMVVRGGLKTAARLRHGELHDNRALSYWCCAWTLLASGSLGVVMEGPMGAIPFWSFLGLACAYDAELAPLRADVTESASLFIRQSKLFVGELPGV